MKSALSIVFTFTAVLLFTFLAVIPHHHHRQAICLLVELCADDCDKSGDGNLHCDAEDEPLADDKCSLAVDYVASPAEDKSLQSKFSFSSLNDLSLFFSLSLLFFDSAFLHYQSPTVDYRYAAFIPGYQSVVLSGEMPLRAPPRS